MFNGIIVQLLCVMITITAEQKELIESNALALATINDDGTPHCIVVGYVKVVSDREILITDNYMVRTVSNLKKNPNIAIVVWNKDWQNNCVGYELKGKVRYYNDGKWIQTAKKIPENEGEPCKGAILLEVESIKQLA